MRGRAAQPACAVAPRVRGAHVLQRLGRRRLEQRPQPAQHGPGHPGWRASRALSSAHTAGAAPGYAAAARAARGPGAKLPPPAALRGGSCATQRSSWLLGGVKPGDQASHLLARLCGLGSQVPKPLGLSLVAFVIWLRLAWDVPELHTWVEAAGA